MITMNVFKYSSSYILYCYQLGNFRYFSKCRVSRFNKQNNISNIKQNIRLYILYMFCSPI